jgi:homoserine dehydrogenase
VLNRPTERALVTGIPERLVEHDADRLFAKPHDIVIELIGGTDAADELIERSLRAGRSVITANKTLLAKRLDEFLRIADEIGASLLYSASVGGALPAFEFAEKNADDIAAISGILNGTCNFICERIAAGDELETAIADAQTKGFAEADPTLDIDGTDTAQKLSLLVRKVFGADVPAESIDRKGVRKLTTDAFRKVASRGKTIRLIAAVERTASGFNCSVGPREVLLDGVFGSVKGAGNCLVIREHDGHERLVKAAGAGRYPTAESVVADAFELYRRHQRTPIKLAAKAAEAAI